MASGDRFLHRGQNLGSLLVSSPQGHSGKTVVAIGLCRVLKRKGLTVQPFKKGPDYIDPSWLTAAAQRNCHNLDFFLIPKDKLLASFQRASQEADISVIEGAMGLYDGLDFVEYGSTAQVARLLNSPILLVVNTTRMTGSIAAMVKGYQHFEADIPIAAVILNHVSGIRHENKLKTAVEQHCGIPVVGSIPNDTDLHISERHMGLVPSLETEESEIIIERIGRKMESYLDLDHILAIAREYGPPHPAPLPPRERGKNKYALPQGEREPLILPRPLGEREPLILPRPLGERDGVRGSQVRIAKIGVILDRAFHFYYPENLQALNRAGAELIFINSLKDRLPEIDGLYIGGGFPEFFLEELEANRKLHQDIADGIEGGLAVYAECAGLMYLCRSISWKGRSYKMVGSIPADVELSEKPRGHGYVIAEVVEQNPLFPVGLILRGHEFHHSSLLPLHDLACVCRIKRGEGIASHRDGIVYKNLFASYIHLHALGAPEWAEGLVSLASKRRRTDPQVYLSEGPD